MNVPSKPKKKKKAGRPRKPEPESFLFEIKDWEPSYSFSVDYDRLSNTEYSEFMQIHFHAVCLLPKKYQGRIIKFTFNGVRDCLEPKISKSHPDWKPKDAGFLELGWNSFHASIPHDSIGFLMDAIARGTLRFVLLYGGQLKRGSCFSTSIEFMKSVDLDDC